MTKNTPQLISGRKRFLNNIRMEENFGLKFINGIDLSYLINDTLMHESQQFITGEKVFVGDLLVNN